MDVEKWSGIALDSLYLKRDGGSPGAGPYAVARGGLMVFTKSLARELAPCGIRVNCVSPGVIDTPFHTMFSTPEMMANVVKAIPLGRVGTADECARVIAFLASNAASYVVGETIEVMGPVDALTTNRVV